MIIKCVSCYLDSIGRGYTPVSIWVCGVHAVGLNVASQSHVPVLLQLGNMGLEEVFYASGKDHVFSTVDRGMGDGAVPEAVNVFVVDYDKTRA